MPPGALPPAPKGMPACPCKHATTLAVCLGLGCCMHAQALATACPWGATLALAAAYPCLGCVPMGGCPSLGCCMPWPWLPTHRGYLGLGCYMPWAGSGHPKGMPACTPRYIAPHRPTLQQNWLMPFSIFVSLNSSHDFRGVF